MNGTWRRSGLRIGARIGALALVLGHGACSTRPGLGVGGRSGSGTGGTASGGGASGTGGGSAGTGGTGGSSGTGGTAGGQDGGVDRAPSDGPATGTGGADAGPPIGTLRFQDPPGRDLDMLFMIDDSLSMTPLQAKLAQQLPTFMNVLKSLPGGQPNLHVAVISSSLGAGVFSNVAGCAPGAGNAGGAFQHNTAMCPGLLSPSAHFLSSVFSSATGNYVNNFSGDIAAAFACIALLGQNGCGFEHQFGSTMVALQKANAENMGQPADPDNGGFLRPNANLAVVMLTNEDDCSASPDSTLFDPGVESVNDPSGLGGLTSYRCNAFGHLCGPNQDTPPPHTVTDRVTLDNCTSAEGKSPGDAAHQLITVKSFVDFLTSLKPGHPERLFVSAFAGPATPYVVEPHTFQLSSGGTEVQPWMVHSCTSGTAGTEYADPAVRIKNFLDAFGANGVLEPICANDFGPGVTAVASGIVRRTGTNCVQGQVVLKTDGTPDCRVALTAPGAATSVALPSCDATRSVVPCWLLRVDAALCGTGRVFDLCRDPACAAPGPSTSLSSVDVACTFQP